VTLEIEVAQGVGSWLAFASASRQRLCELWRPPRAGHHCRQGRAGCRHGACGRLLAVAPRVWPWLRPSSRAVRRYRGPMAGSNHTRRPPDEG